MVEVTHSNEWYLRDLAVWYGKQFLRVPYEWGDEDHTGMDCSGLISEVLVAVGVKPHGWRPTSTRMSKDFKKVWDSHMDIRLWADSGMVVCYGTGIVTHVALAISRSHVITASGGGSETDTPEEADTENAFVKLRPINYRKDAICVVDPFYIKEAIT